MYKFLIIIFISLTSFSCLSQKHDSLYNNYIKSEEKYLSFLTAISFGKNVFGEIGISKNTEKINHIHPVWIGKSISFEFNKNENFTIAPKIGIWASGGNSALSIGLNFGYYTNFSNGTLTMQPEIGIGMLNFRFVYARNFRLTNTNFENINLNSLKIAFWFKLKNIK